MQPNEQVIRRFAHQIWESEGKPEGQAARHWEMACRLATGETGPADPLEPLSVPNTTRQEATPEISDTLLGPAEHEVSMAVAEPEITPPPARVRVKAVVDDPAAAPPQKTSAKATKTRPH